MNLVIVLYNFSSYKKITLLWNFNPTIWSEKIIFETKFDIYRTPWRRGKKFIIFKLTKFGKKLYSTMLIDLTKEREPPMSIFDSYVDEFT